jgi:DNA-binding NarL/FixJ family response regulator
VSGQLRLLIADCAATRAGIRLALEGEVEICAEADHSEQAIRAAKREQPDICIVSDDLRGSGLTAVRGVSRAAPGASVVVLCQSDDVDLLLDYVRAGAVGYLPGALDAQRLRRVVTAVAANEAVVPRSMVLELVREIRDRGHGAGALTARESQVLGMLRRGRSTAEIAVRLEIAPVTVRRYVSDVVRKLGVENRASLTNLVSSPSSNF